MSQAKSKSCVTSSLSSLWGWLLMTNLSQKLVVFYLFLNLHENSVSEARCALCLAASSCKLRLRKLLSSVSGYIGHQGNSLSKTRCPLCLAAQHERSVSEACCVLCLARSSEKCALRNWRQHSVSETCCVLCLARSSTKFAHRN